MSRLMQFAVVSSGNRIKSLRTSLAAAAENSPSSQTRSSIKNQLLATAWTASRPRDSSPVQRRTPNLTDSDLDFKADRRVAYR